MDINNEKHYFDKLLDIIYKRLAINCRQYNEAYIKRRLNARITANDLEANNYSAYIDILEKKTEELRTLFDALTINVTKFFRDKKLWNYLKSVVFPQVISEKKTGFDNVITVWSCGCSSGEEPYSIAILLSELVGNNRFMIRVTASDIDELSLEKARNAVYSTESLTEIPKEYVDKYFLKIENKDLYKVTDRIKTLVFFKRQDLFTAESSNTKYDIIFCRNVIIYFTAEAKERLVNMFYKSLNDNGWLVIGESELLFEKHLKCKFYLFDEKERMYRRERRIYQEKIEVERRKRWWFGYPPKPQDLI